MQNEIAVRKKYNKLTSVQELNPRLKTEIEPMLNVLRWVLQGEGNVREESW
jgi:hypothetical protein